MCKEIRNVGRPRSEDPKLKLDSIRLKSSNIIDIEVLSDEMGISKNELVQTMLETQIRQLKKLLKIE